jgi:dimethylargininase
MNFSHAITRKPGVNFAAGITTANLGEPDYALILKQHAAYVAALRDLGLEVILLEPLDDFPDAYFVEDVAVVTAEVAVITYPGAQARQGEQAHIETTLAAYRPLVHIRPPGTLEGGDVMQVEKRIFVGLTERSNEDGINQLRELLRPYGYTVHSTPVPQGLHLKSSVNYIGQNTILVTPAFAELPELAGFNMILLEEEEAYAANTLLVNERLIAPKGFPHTLQKLERAGFEVIELDVSEVRKMDGGLSCMSLRF